MMQAPDQTCCLRTTFGCHTAVDKSAYCTDSEARPDMTRHVDAVPTAVDLNFPYYNIDDIMSQISRGHGGWFKTA